MFILPDLPYAHSALEPTVSEKTLRFHHGKHHKGYVETTNKLLADSPATDLETVVRTAEGKLFNNAAQAWNHGFFWESMTPDYAAPGGVLAPAIDRFGGLDALKTAFVDEGAGHFASGWVWIIAEGGSLKVISTHDAGSPIRDGQHPILVCDVWEHAYYLDHQNDRKGFLTAWFDRLANWRFAENQLRAAMGQAAPYRYPPPKDAGEETQTAQDQDQKGTARPGDPAGLSA